MASLIGIFESMRQRMGSGSVENLSVTSGIVLIYRAPIMKKGLRERPKTYTDGETWE